MCEQQKTLVQRMCEISDIPLLVPGQALVAGPVWGPSAALARSSGLSDYARLSKAGPSGVEADGNICMGVSPDYIGPETEK